MQVLNSVIHNITIVQPNSSATSTINVSDAIPEAIPVAQTCAAPPELAMDENVVRFKIGLFRAFFEFWLQHCNACME